MKIPKSAADPIEPGEEKNQVKEERNIRNIGYENEFLTVSEALDLINSLSAQLMIDANRRRHE
jgi:hypothetical protein